MGVLERATEKVGLEDRFEMFGYYIAKATENFGLPATRSIYEKTIKSLPNTQTAEMCLRFASLEQKLGEIDRARAIYAHSSQFYDPRTSPKFFGKRTIILKSNMESSRYYDNNNKISSTHQDQVGSLDDEGDPMSQLEKNEPSVNFSFVLSKERQEQLDQKVKNDVTSSTANVDEIAIDDDED
ncbi:hypothetical protein Pst134EA_032668 [Puccinia striiformis f. sp. tritici]|uniref:uncharacterized protein n=1 Tax=Puccinia striiformis f. sp. tritici TaxID=168172 RepID=UPI0020075873|nr:uncharacterized protein Pst134EA_032668 [Puccinia striiformis f. sp. tritici]KAH9441678.1 hypothetical protein Pst134EA_032668 [Puccinia striiformis f. sp. tritici]